jgi:GT2 family glycosyltransferase
LQAYSRYGKRCGAVGGSVRDMTRVGHPLQFKRGITNQVSETIAIRDRKADFNAPNGQWFNGLMGTNASFRKALLEQIGGYDEFFDYFLDETDVCLRLIQAGYEVHYTDSVMEHYPASSHNRVDQKHLTCWYALAKNTTYFALKHGLGRMPLPILLIRLARVLIYRCLLRILRLQWTHRLPVSIILDYVRQTVAGALVGWQAGMALHQESPKPLVSQWTQS